MKKVLVIMGTRPEAIKLAPVVIELEKSGKYEKIVCSTGQHKEMLNSALENFGIKPDFELQVMVKGQTLNSLAGSLFLAIEKMLDNIHPDCILVQGDTTTAFVGAVAGFHRRISVGHVEAGLRSGDLNAPFPEEFNRKAVAIATHKHFAPTKRAAGQLKDEGVPPENIHLVGNTVVDSVAHMIDKIHRNPPKLHPVVEEAIFSKKPYILVTGHRRENFGKGIENICQAISQLADWHRDHLFIYPVHMNPNVCDIVSKRLQGHDNILLIPPAGYKELLRMMENCTFILSDSGGIQEEAPSFGKKVLVMRDVTERPEGVEAGFCRLVGTDPQVIVKAVEETIISPDVGTKSNPYGDGHAARRIVEILGEMI